MTMATLKDFKRRLAYDSRLTSDTARRARGRTLERPARPKSYTDAVLPHPGGKPETLDHFQGAERHANAPLTASVFGRRDTEFDDTPRYGPSASAMLCHKLVAGCVCLRLPSNSPKKPKLKIPASQPILRHIRVRSARLCTPEPLNANQPYWFGGVKTVMVPDDRHLSRTNDVYTSAPPHRGCWSWAPVLRVNSTLSPHW
jgi:hypothetical protein